jgi:hypothetical protein
METTHIFLTSGTLRALIEVMRTGEPTGSPHPLISGKMHALVTITSIKASENGRVYVELYDGDATVCALLSDELIESSLCDAHLNNICADGISCMQLRIGMVIQVRRYSLHSCEEEHKTFMQVDEFETIGVQQRNEQLVNASSKSNGATKNSENTCQEVDLIKVHSLGNTCNNSDEWPTTHRLEHLAPVLKSWSVRAYVTGISPLTEFMRTNNTCGKFKRVQLRDTNSQLELVVFEPYCHREPFSSLEIYKQVHLTDGEIKTAKSGMTKWPYELLSREQKSKFRQLPYEIQVNKNTCMKICTGEDEVERSYVCGDENLCKAESGSASETYSTSFSASDHHHEEEHQTRAKVDTTLPQPIQSLPRACLLLSRVVMMPNKSLTTVLCVVCKMMPFDAARDTIESKSSRYKLQKDIHVRRIVVVDTSGVTVPVALWGDQAKYCTLEVGHCVLLKEVEVSNYNSFSLSVVQKTGIMCFGSCDALNDDVNATRKKHSKASRIVDCSSSRDAFFVQLAEWWQTSGSRLYKDKSNL